MILLVLLLVSICQKRPIPLERLGRTLDASDYSGTSMSQWVMNYKGTVLPLQTLCYLNVGEINSDTEEQKRKDFDAKIKLKLGDSLSPSKETIEHQETYADYTKG